MGTVFKPYRVCHEFRLVFLGLAWLGHSRHERTVYLFVWHGQPESLQQRGGVVEVRGYQRTQDGVGKAAIRFEEVERCNDCLSPDGSAGGLLRRLAAQAVLQAHLRMEIVLNGQEAGAIPHHVRAGHTAVDQGQHQNVAVWCSFIVVYHCGQDGRVEEMLRPGYSLGKEVGLVDAGSWRQTEYDFDGAYCIFAQLRYASVGQQICRVSGHPFGAFWAVQYMVHVNPVGGNTPVRANLGDDFAEVVPRRSFDDALAR